MSFAFRWKCEIKMEWGGPERRFPGKMEPLAYISDSQRETGAKRRYHCPYMVPPTLQNISLQRNRDPGSRDLNLDTRRNTGR